MKIFLMFSNLNSYFLIVNAKVGCASIPNHICLMGTIIFSGKKYNSTHNPRVKEISHRIETKVEVYTAIFSTLLL